MSIFQEYVTSTAFSLTLSKNQIACLCAVDQLGMPTGGVGSSRGVIHRGLVIHTSIPKPIEGCAYREEQKWELTEAGKALIPLIKLAGLYVDFKRYTKYEPKDIPLVGDLVTLKRDKELIGML